MPNAYTFSGGSLKSIPFDQMPPEAWKVLTGGTGTSYGALALYESVPWLYASVELIAGTLSSIPTSFHDTRTGKVVDRPPLPFHFDVYEALTGAGGDLLLFGAAYWHKGVNRMGLPTQLKRMLPSSVKPEYSEDTGLTGFKRALGGTVLPLSVSDVAYVWKASRSGEIGPGVPPVKAALKAAGMLKDIDDYAIGFFQNGAVETTILFFDGNPSAAELEKVETRLRRSLTSIRNAFRFIALRTKPEVVKLGSTPDKLTLPELTDSKRQDVATALGVPHSLLYSADASEAVAREDDLHFYGKTVIPMALHVCAALSAQVFRPFGLALKPHPERLEVFQQMEVEKADSLSLMFDRGALTVNEYRTWMGFPARHDDPHFDMPRQAAKAVRRR